MYNLVTIFLKGDNFMFEKCKKIMLFSIVLMLLFNCCLASSLAIFAVEEEPLQLALNYNPNVDRNEIAQLLDQIDSEYEARYNSIVPYASYGAAWPYKSVTSTSINCYGYAANLQSFLNPGDLAYTNGALHTGDSVNKVAGYVLADMGRKYRVDSRIISSATASISSNEYRIALRVGHQNVNGSLVYDYHFLLQCSDGAWCDKPGAYRSRKLGNINPSTYSWDLLYTNGSVAKSNFYNSSTVYIAVRVR